MVTNIELALMAGFAYQSTRKEVNWFPAPQGWTIIGHPNDPSGFEAVSFQNVANPNEIVISFAGTYLSATDLRDIQADMGLAEGLGSAQLLQAAEYYLQVKAQVKAANPNATITLTGHSLGGGLAALVGVFFGVKAVTFDQAPFEKSAVAAYNPNTLEPTDPATILLAQLQHNGHTPGDLTGLTNFLQLRAANGGIPNSNLVSNIRVDGEFLSCAPFSLYHTIGTSIPPLTHGTTDVSGENLHSISLLTAFLQNDKFRDVTTKLTDLLEMIFDKNLYWFIQPTPPTQQIPTSLNSSSATKQGYKAPLPPITCLTASPTI